MVEAAGADLVDINFGCPVRKVTKTGAGASLLDEPHRAAAIVESVAQAVEVPVCVKMRRGVENGSRTSLEVGPQLVEAGAASLTLHPRSAQQMYTGTADHALTAELVELVDVPVVASGDITSRERAESVLAETGCAAVMEISIPGAITPPTYSPALETASKFVEVPKSTTMHGAP